MNVDVLLGLQWGDEGKGKVVDVLSPRYDIVARFQGGPNAGHTLEFEGKQFIAHHIPCGLFQNKVVVLGNGMVIDVVELAKEIKEVIAKDLMTFENIQALLLIANKASLILPSHKSMDYVKEKLRGKGKIGSTLRGIGPAYADKTSRNGLLARDLFSENFLEKYEKLKKAHLHFAESHGMNLDAEKATREGTEKVFFDSMEKDFFEAIEFVKQFTFISCETYLHEQIMLGKKIWVEGAQGSILDIMYGSYPFVTSSNTTIGGVITGLGVSPQDIGEVYGLFKAYCTRVGSGPFPTELFDGKEKLDALGKKMFDVGKELGATTGRVRRCGWLDLVMLKYACMINGVTQLIMTKADVLANFETIKVATAYVLKDGTTTNDMPEELDDVVELSYVEFDSWPEIRGLNNADAMPGELETYISLIEGYLNIPLTIVSTGPDRDEIMYL